jgi:curved DNA-binding protein CbpA
MAWVPVPSRVLVFPGIAAHPDTLRVHGCRNDSDLLKFLSPVADNPVAPDLRRLLFMAKSLYDILEVSASASYEGIRAAYERLSRKYDPDLDEHRGNAETRLRHEAIKEAFFTLGNTQKGARYDRSLVDAAGAMSSTLDTQDSIWTMPKILVIIAALLLGGGWYMSHKHNEQKLAAERAIAEARAKEAEAKAKAEAEAAELARIALQRERELARDRTYQESRTRSEFERTNREFERERRRQEFTDRYSEERQKRESQSEARRIEMERQRQDAIAVAEAQRRAVRERAELCRIERERYGKAISCP